MHAKPNPSQPRARAKPAQLIVSDAAAGALRARVATNEEIDWFEQQLDERHYLGGARDVGDYLRQIICTAQGDPVALLAWGPACYALKDRDRHIGWCANHRIERLKLVVQNRRYLLLFERGEAPNLASKALACALRALPGQWLERFGYQPVLAESFTDPRTHQGACYKAANWEQAGSSAGYSRTRGADFYTANESPKHLWLYKLRPDAKTILCAPQLDALYAPALAQAPQGALPLSQPQLESLHEALARVPDPRAANKHYRLNAVLSIIAMALLIGRREVAEMVRFGQTLTQNQRRDLGLPRKAGSKFFKAPGYKVYYQLLRQIDPEAFAKTLNTWLRARAGELPGALAMDGKMIREHIGTLTLASHEDGTPLAMAVYDQKEGTKRCEQTAAQALLESLPRLDGQIITADALHCQKQTARLIIEKGGDYVLQIKPNQKSLLKAAQTICAQSDTPFFRK